MTCNQAFQKVMINWLLGRSYIISLFFFYKKESKQYYEIRCLPLVTAEGKTIFAVFIISNIENMFLNRFIRYMGLFITFGKSILNHLWHRCDSYRHENVNYQNHICGKNAKHRIICYNCPWTRKKYKRMWEISSP